MLAPFSQKMERTILNWINVDRYLPMQIDITNACNLRCGHCYHPHHKNDGAIELSSWLKILDQYDTLTKRLGFRPSIIICGGEPLLSKHFEPILENLLARSTPYKVMVLTNGTITDSKKLALMRRFTDIAVQVSIDGPNETSHDAVRGLGSFGKSLSGIRALRELGIPVHMLAVLSKRSSLAIGEFFNLAKSVNANEWDSLD